MKLIALLLLRHIVSMTGEDDEDASTFFMVIVMEGKKNEKNLYLGKPIKA